jgi:hypothetical protein
LGDDAIDRGQVLPQTLAEQDNPGLLLLLAE